MTCALCPDQEKCKDRNNIDKCQYPPHITKRDYIIRANINTDTELYVMCGSECAWTCDKRQAKKFKTPKLACDWMVGNDYGIVDFVVEQLYKHKTKKSRYRYDE